MFNNRPKIAITGPDKGGTAAWLFTAFSVWIAGGKPLRFKPSRPVQINHIKGLILGGGADIDPSEYSHAEFLKDYLRKTLQSKRKTFWQRIFHFFRFLSYPVVFISRKFLTSKFLKTDKERDMAEFNLLEEALEKDLPILGICRGAQLINVYFKGTLFEDIQNFYVEEVNRWSIFPVKKVLLKKDSLLSKIYGRDVIYVNALHHQAVKEPGINMEITGKEPNGLVQAIESHEYSFLVGVQWHPEYLLRKRLQRKLFKEFVKKAKQVHA